VTVTEGNSGTTTASSLVSLSAASPEVVKVLVVVAYSTASPDDFQSTPGTVTLTFAPGEVSKNFDMFVRGDLLYEEDANYFVMLSNPAGAFIADGTGVGTILNDDPQPTVSVGDAAVFEGSGRFGTELEFQLRISAPTGVPVQVRFRTVGDSATPVEDFGVVEGSASFTSNTNLITVRVHTLSDTVIENTETFFLDIFEVTNATISDGRGVGTIFNDDLAAGPMTFQFERFRHTVSEGAHSVAVNVTRTGEPSQAAAVNYITRTEGGQLPASDRNDYTPASGTLRFAAGERTKTFAVLITDDVREEPEEFFTLLLIEPAGAPALGNPAEARVYIEDNDAPPPAANPVDDTQFFVRQHYADFLSREPDAPGFAFWTNEIEQCGADALCREVRRVSVSQAFFFSIEFQQTGYRVFRLYRATFPDAPRRPRGMPAVAEFLRDTQDVGGGVIVGQGDWEEQLRQNVTDLARHWVGRFEVVDQLPETLTAAQYVDKLFSNSGVTPTGPEREEALAAFGAGGTEGRAAALLSVIGSASVFNRQYNTAFVYMQYAGYLRRNPSDLPNRNFAGFDFWLAKLDSFTEPGEDARDETIAARRAQRAELVKAFLSSDEYRKRFGP
jgi:hypothetical protein